VRFDATGAECRDYDPELWFPTNEKAHAWDAKAICGVCPIKDPCATEAIRIGAHGIWGGLTTEERDRQRRRERAATERGTTPGPSKGDYTATEIERLLDNGAIPSDIAAKLGISARAVQRRMYRAGRDDIASEFAHAASIERYGRNRQVTA